MTGLYYAQGKIRQFTRATPLSDIFAAVPERWLKVAAGDVATIAKNDHAIYAVVLAAPNYEQLNFLKALYEETFPDEEFELALKALINRRRLLDVLDWKTEAARERVNLVYLGVMANRGKA